MSTKIEGNLVPELHGYIEGDDPMIIRAITDLRSKNQELQGRLLAEFQDEFNNVWFLFKTPKLKEDPDARSHIESTHWFLLLNVLGFKHLSVSKLKGHPGQEANIIEEIIEAGMRNREPIDKSTGMINNFLKVFF